MGEFFKFITAIWQDNWRDRMFFIIGVALVIFGCFPLFNEYLNLPFFRDLDKGYNVITSISGLLILFFVTKDLIKKNQENNKRRRYLEERIKIKDEIGGYIINNNMRWNIIINPDGKFDLEYPLCPNCEIYMRSNIPTGIDGVWTCPKCNKDISGKLHNIEKELSVVELNKKVDVIKKGLGIK